MHGLAFKDSSQKGSPLRRFRATTSLKANHITVGTSRGLQLNTFATECAQEQDQQLQSILRSLNASQSKLTRNVVKTP
jgi:hypothetical protein